MKKRIGCLGILLFLVLSIVSCNTNDSPSNNGSENINSSTTISSEEIISSITSEVKINYEVVVKKDNGELINGASVSFYKGDVVSFDGTTNEEGKVIINATSDEYIIKVDGLPRGYRPIKDYKTTLAGDKIEIICNVRPYENYVPSYYVYHVGDVMYNFDYYDFDENALTLTELVNDYELVLLNFWYKDCTYCKYEMPFLNSVNQKYQDKIKLIGLDPYDDEDTIMAFAQKYEVNFSVAWDYASLYENFAIVGYPTTVVIDQKGIIRSIHSSAFMSELEFETFIKQFLGTEVEPGEEEPSIDNPSIGPVKPDVTMPKSEDIEKVVNGENFNFHFKNADENDLEYNWPFVISSDGKSIHPSNASYDNSYSIIQTEIHLKKNQVFAFDYLTSCENYDILYVLVDRKLFTQISGLSETWKTSYAFVAGIEADYTISFCFQKDESDSIGDDTVYLKNFRILSSDVIDEPTYMLREASIGTYSSIGYENYVTCVFNEEDGYYHVGTMDGPILMASLLTSTNFSTYTVYDYAVNGFFEGKELERITEYARLCANNETGCACVTQELYLLLDKFIKKIVDSSLGTIKYGTNRWLEVCVYFDAYGTDGVELSDPNKGLSFHCAYECEEGNDNKIYVAGPIIPRPIYSKFEPSSTGVYKVNTLVDEETILFMYDEEGNEFAQYDELSRIYFRSDLNYNDPDSIMYVYLEEGKTYYVGVNYYDMQMTGEITFSIEYLGTTFANFESCSPGYFTCELDDEGNMNGAIIALTIDVQLGEDGYYHQLNEDGTLGSIIYCDFTFATAIFDKSIAQMIQLGGFDFSKDEEGNATNLPNKTSEIMSYRSKIITTPGDTYGCVPVDEKLAELLQMLMDKYTFAEVEGSWQKLCYYYHSYGE